MLQFPIAISSSFSSSHFYFSPAYASTLHSSPIIWSHHAPLSHMPTSMPVFPFHSYLPSCLPSPSSFPFSPWVHCDIAAHPSPRSSLLCVSEWLPSLLWPLYCLLRGSPDLPNTAFTFPDIPTNFALFPVYRPKFASLCTHLSKPPSSPDSSF